MEVEHKININNIRTTSFLFAPLDWGLGHTTRCIPIIKRLQEQGINVQVACNRVQSELIRRELAGIEILDLDGYSLSYGRSRISTVVTIVLQIPKILMRIKRERQWLHDLLSNHHVDVIVSDSRFGFTHPASYSIFLTHQLRIKSPFGKWIDSTLQKWNLSFINKFNECWVVDFDGKNNLAGELSHPKNFPSIPTKYIGALSRFRHSETAEGPLDLLIILSGPEPQRSIFEKLMLENLGDFEGTFSFAKNFAGTELEKKMRSARLIISRTGYTTVMDIVAMKKKSVLIPTPGQSEQEYLGKYLTEKRIALCIPQKSFNLKSALARAATFDYAEGDKFDLSHYERFVDQFLIDQNFLRR